MCFNHGILKNMGRIGRSRGWWSSGFSMWGVFGEGRMISIYICSVLVIDLYIWGRKARLQITKASSTSVADGREYDCLTNASPNRPEGSWQAAAPPRGPQVGAELALAPLSTFCAAAAPCPAEFVAWPRPSGARQQSVGAAGHSSAHTNKTNTT